MLAIAVTHVTEMMNSLNGILFVEKLSRIGPQTAKARQRNTHSKQLMHKKFCVEWCNINLYSCFQAILDDLTFMHSSEPHPLFVKPCSTNKMILLLANLILYAEAIEHSLIG